MDTAKHVPCNSVIRSAQILGNAIYVLTENGTLLYKTIDNLDVQQPWSQLIDAVKYFDAGIDHLLACTENGSTFSLGSSDHGQLYQ